jgi:hypothetical protein
MLVADFVSDKLADGRSHRIPTVFDQFTKECIALEADRSLHGTHVVAALIRAIEERGTAPRASLWTLAASLSAERSKPGQSNTGCNYASTSWKACRKRVHRKLQWPAAR